MMQERSRRINAERYAVIREEYSSTLADIDLTLEEMVSASAAAQCSQLQQESTEEDGLELYRTPLSGCWRIGLSRSLAWQTTTNGKTWPIP